MVEDKAKDEDWVRWKCPRDCPFNNRLGDHIDRYCCFAEYADVLEPGRYSRTEVAEDGTVNYHKWPDCDIYPRYKGLNKVVWETKRRRQVEHQIGLKASPTVKVTGHKHPATQKHHGEF